MEQKGPRELGQRAKVQDTVGNIPVCVLTGTIGARARTAIGRTRLAGLRSAGARISSTAGHAHSEANSMTHDAAQPGSPLARLSNACARLSTQSTRGVEAARRAARRSGLKRRA